MPELYQGGVSAGEAGDEAVRARLGTDVLRAGAAELGRDEVNELLGYLGWNFWDATGGGIGSEASGTGAEGGVAGGGAAGGGAAGDGTAGGVAEGGTAAAGAGTGAAGTGAAGTGAAGTGAAEAWAAEAVGALQAWQRYPAVFGLIGSELGADGLVGLGAGGRRQLGGALNTGHWWSLAVAFGLGRGVSMALGRIDGQQGETPLRNGLGFIRGLAAGLRGPGAPLFNSMDGYRVSMLDQDWLDWLLGQLDDGRGFVADGWSELDAATGELAALLRFGHRAARCQHGPYPVGDGAYLRVRDHFLAEPAYHWADVADGLPHVVTQALLLRTATPPRVSDSGVLLDDPGAPAAVAVFAKDHWDTPADQLRLLSPTDCAELVTRCGQAGRLLSRRIERMPRRDRVLAAAQVYYTEPVIPIARAAGCWPRLVNELDFFELDPLVSEAYYELVPDGAAGELLPRLIAAGTAFPPVKNPISVEEAMPALHLLAVRGGEAELPVDPGELMDAGLIAADPPGYRLTEAGQAVHERLLAAERKTYETERLAQAYQRFVALDEPMGALVAQWQTDDGARREELLVELADVVQRARVALRRTNEQLVRFEPYLPKLRRALARAQEGQAAYVADPDVESLYTVWQVLHRDYRLTQGLT